MELAERVHRDARQTWRPRPVKRVYIPKAGNRAKLRPLGIPGIADRCHQGKGSVTHWNPSGNPGLSLNPMGSGRAEAATTRSQRDLPDLLFGKPKVKRVWALDADLAAAFDRIDHEKLLEALGSFPARDLIRDWLKAGVIEAGKGFTPTGEGTPQGGVISPLLLNVALHGLETAAGVRYYPADSNRGRGAA